MIKPCLTWNELDACAMADDIAKLLAERSIRGRREKPKSCPLAMATGDTVFSLERFDRKTRSRSYLTDAEREFVERFDDGEYPDLDISRN